MDRYVCVHGHFYQPPRENAWLESVEVQDSAHPYHDWNERITAECYGPNAWARILDGDGRIVDIVNNYARISFNFGPTLLSWLEEKAPKVYAAILEGDRLSRERYAGHGSAIAQAYNHMILPLANRRDKYTQIRWGIRDFEHRFQRAPEGMWLPETAVDKESLSLMAEQGIKFTILSPYQASRFRKIGVRHWRDGTEGKIDPSRAYRVRLSRRQQIAVFFYDGPISRAVAFEKLLDNGETFANRLLDGFNNSRDWPQLVHIATDGESYGHHHRGGEMALAYALRHIEEYQPVKLTNYGEYLEKHPPEQEVEIAENTAWSCVHGVGRWERDCGCNSGGHGDWNQSWRAPLRNALNDLRDTLAEPYECRAKELLKDPWAARNGYIEVILDRSDHSLEEFLKRHAVGELSHEQTVDALRLLELQRHAMLMFTSCAWFFDEISGIETVQVLQYAARTLQLAEETLGRSFEDEFLAKIENAKSNIPEFENGRKIYEMWVRPARVDLKRLAVHFAFICLFEDQECTTSVYAYDVRDTRHEHAEVGRMRYLVGRAQFSSRITRAHTSLSYAVLHWGDHNLIGGVREFEDDPAFESLRQDGLDLFRKANIGGLTAFLNERFGASVYSMATLFKDEQRQVIRHVVAERMAEVDEQFRVLLDHHAPLTRFMIDLSLPVPRQLRVIGETVLGTRLRSILREPDPDLQQARATWKEMKDWPGLDLDIEQLGHTFDETMHRLMERLSESPRDLNVLRQCAEFAAFIRETSVPMNLAESQNILHGLQEDVRGDMQSKSQGGDDQAGQWCQQFDALAGALWFKTS